MRVWAITAGGCLQFALRIALGDSLDMVNRFLVVSMVLACLGSPSSARAEGGNFGLGVVIGTPTGVAGKWYLADSHAIDFAVGFSIIGAEGVHIHADYLWHPWHLASESKFDLGVYVGIGGRFLEHDRGNRFFDDDDDFHIGPRAPIGLLFDFSRAGAPIDVFIEAALGIDFIFDDDNRNGRGDHDGVDINLHAAFGARYYF